MLQILLCGSGGRMGRAFIEAATAAGHVIAAGVDIAPAAAPFPVFADAREYAGEADVIVDFSHHSALPSLLEAAVTRGIPLVVATTGHSEEELAAMKEAAARVPVFHAGNFSLGIALLTELCRRAAAFLGPDYDVEIIEKHHNKKLDAPSGTALMLADAVRSADSEPHPLVYDRHGERRERARGEIGVHSVRGGGIVGEHDVLFAGRFETVTLSHSAASREVFAAGAVRAAEFLTGQPAGLYGMDDLVRSFK